MKQILIVEDDITLNNTLSFNLSQNNFITTSAYSMKKALYEINHHTFDLIIIDINLPDGDGFSLCKSVKNLISSTSAIVFLTANDLECDIIKGYNLGADDHITKPFSFRVFQKKISAIMNRINTQVPERKYVDSHLQLNFDSLTATIDAVPIEFTPLEFQLLELFSNNARHILTRQQIMDILWDKRGNYVDDSSLNSIVCRIRNKIDTDRKHYIKTVYGTGYMWMGGD